MVKRFLSKLLNKPLYKAEVIITSDDFIAEYHSDTISSCLSWTLVGLQETRSTSTELKLSFTKGIYGRIMPLKVFSFNKNSIGFMSYKKPATEDYLFMTDQMIHVPESIMKHVRKEEPNLLKQGLL